MNKFGFKQVVNFPNLLKIIHNDYFQFINVIKNTTYVTKFYRCPRMHPWTYLEKTSWNYENLRNLTSSWFSLWKVFKKCNFLRQIASKTSRIPSKLSYMHGGNLEDIFWCVIYVIKVHRCPIMHSWTFLEKIRSNLRNFKNLRSSWFSLWKVSKNCYFFAENCLQFISDNFKVCTCESSKAWQYFVICNTCNKST